MHVKHLSDGHVRELIFHFPLNPAPLGRGFLFLVKPLFLLSKFPVEKEFQVGIMGSMGALKPRLNQESLKVMAERHRRYIHASAYRSRLLSFFAHYLTHLINELGLKKREPHELYEWEKELEAIEAALIHLWIDLPYNGCLYTPNRLPDEQIARISTIARKTRLNPPHLRIAYSKAA